MYIGRPAVMVSAILAARHRTFVLLLHHYLYCFFPMHNKFLLLLLLLLECQSPFVAGVGEKWNGVDRSPVTNRTHSVSSKIIAQQYLERAGSFVFGRFWLSVRTLAFTEPHFHNCTHGATFFPRRIFSSRFIAMPCQQWPMQDVQDQSKSRTLR